jgi:hypothetical protein
MPSNQDTPYNAPSSRLELKNEHHNPENTNQIKKNIGVFWLALVASELFLSSLIHLILILKIWEDVDTISKLTAPDDFSDPVLASYLLWIYSGWEHYLVELVHYYQHWNLNKLLGLLLIAILHLTLVLNALLMLNMAIFRKWLHAFFGILMAVTVAKYLLLIKFGVVGGTGVIFNYICVIAILTCVFEYLIILALGNKRIID